MIEWKKYEVMRGAQFPKDKKFLVTNGKWVGVASHYHERIDGYQWWDENGHMLTGITHFAEINLPNG